jgi:hypothetical protein
VSVKTETGDCLVCNTRQPLQGTDVIGRHLVNQPQMKMAPSFSGGYVCLGSGHVPQLHDGLDDVRSDAVHMAAGVDGDVGIERAAMLGALNSGWKMDNAVDYYAGKIVRLETTVALWRGLAGHGDWLTAYADALRLITSVTVSGSPMDHALAHERQQGARVWLHAARNDLVRYAEQRGQDDLVELIYSL